MSADLRRGAVLWAAPDPTIGVEQAGRRPFVVVESKAYLEIVTNLVLSVPVTTTERGWPNNIELSGDTGLAERCFAMTEQVRAISRRRIESVTGHVDARCMAAIDEWLRDFLELR